MLCYGVQYVFNKQAVWLRANLIETNLIFTTYYCLGYLTLCTFVIMPDDVTYLTYTWSSGICGNIKDIDATRKNWWHNQWVTFSAGIIVAATKRKRQSIIPVGKMSLKQRYPRRPLTSVKGWKVSEMQIGSTLVSQRRCNVEVRTWQQR